MKRSLVLTVMMVGALATAACGGENEDDAASEHASNAISNPARAKTPVFGCGPANVWQDELDITLGPTEAVVVGWKDGSAPASVKVEGPGGEVRWATAAFTLTNDGDPTVWPQDTRTFHVTVEGQAKGLPMALSCAHEMKELGHEGYYDGESCIIYDTRGTDVDVAPSSDYCWEMSGGFSKSPGYCVFDGRSAPALFGPQIGQVHVDTNRECT